jgi:Bacterial Ig domain
VTSSPVSIQILNPAPAISISSPANGSTVKGTVALQATAAISPGESESISSIEFYDNGSSLGTGSRCPSKATACTSTLSWNTTGLTGSFSLTARLHAKGGPPATSPAISVQVVSPPPSIVMTSPPSGAGVRGTVVLRANAAIDSSQSDSIADVKFFANGLKLGDGSGCAHQATTCTATFSWNSKGTTRAASLWAVVRTNRGVSATSTKIRVVPFRATSVSLHALPSPTVGQSAIVAGRVVTKSGTNGAGGLVVRVTVTPITGQRMVLKTSSSSSGTFSVRFQASHDAKIQVTVVGNDLFGGSTTSQLLTVRE